MTFISLIPLSLIIIGKIVIFNIHIVENVHRNIYIYIYIYIFIFLYLYYDRTKFQIHQKPYYFLVLISELTSIYYVNDILAG